MRTIGWRFTLAYIFYLCASLAILGGALYCYLWTRGELLALGWQYLAVLFGLILLGGALAGLHLVIGVSRPLKEITAAARSVSGGNPEVEAPHRRHDEIGELAEALNEVFRSVREKTLQLAESRGRLEAVLANMESGVILFDHRGRINLVNPAAERILGISKARAAGGTYVEILKNYPLIRCIDEVLATGKPRGGEISLIFPEERILDAQAAPVFGERREPPGVILVLHDISEIRRLERVRAEFVANVSHELKTPVTSIKGFAETLLDGALYNPLACEEFVSIIGEEAERLNRLINDLLSLSRIESRELIMQVETLDLGPEIRQIADRIEPRFQKKELGLAVAAPGHPVKVRADRDRLEQVLLNLLENSLMYTPSGGRVEVGFQEQEGMAVVSVRDTGIGIPPDDLPRIFERFYRVDRGRSRKLGGTGLGLAIVKHIVEAHGGRVWVESRLGQGSTFYFTLPLNGTACD